MHMARVDLQHPLGFLRPLRFLRVAAFGDWARVSGRDFYAAGAGLVFMDGLVRVDLARGLRRGGRAAPKSRRGCTSGATRSEGGYSRMRSPIRWVACSHASSGGFQARVADPPQIGDLSQVIEIVLGDVHHIHPQPRAGLAVERSALCHEVRVALTPLHLCQNLLLDLAHAPGDLGG